MRKIITENYARITKKQAEVRYNTGQDVYLLPCKMHPENIWQKPMLVSKDLCDCDAFQSVLNNFEYYNCNYNELGKYTAFYITRKEYDERMNKF